MNVSRRMIAWAVAILITAGETAAETGRCLVETVHDETMDKSVFEVAAMGAQFDAGQPPEGTAESTTSTTKLHDQDHGPFAKWSRIEIAFTGPDSRSQGDDIAHLLLDEGHFVARADNAVAPRLFGNPGAEQNQF